MKTGELLDMLWVFSASVLCSLFSVVKYFGVRLTYMNEIWCADVSPQDLQKSLLVP